MRALPAYVVRCEPPKGCGWWWEVYPVKRHWWSRVTKRYRGPWFPEGNDAARWQTAEQFEDYGDCFPHLQRHEFIDGLRMRGMNV